MALESITYISDFVSTNPASGDPVSQADDHLRGIKAGILATFPNITGAVTKSHTELNWVPRGHIAGLTLSTAGSSSTFAVAAGEATDSTAAALMQLAASISKTTGSWAVGTGNGALDTGTIANSTWYHVHLIRRPDTGVVDVLISLSATSPTMPSGYTERRRIGSLRTNGSAQWTAFTQIGENFEWTTPTSDVNVSTLGTTPTNYTLTVPTGVIVTARIGAVFSNASTWLAYLYRVGQTATTLVVARGSGGVANGTGIIQILTNTSAQITGESTAASTTIQITTAGWIDTRGKND